jgi:sugar/nucleoside kinase (ribokinase family)
MSVLKKKFGVAAIAIALVDVLAEVGDAFIAAAGMDKGGMSLIGLQRVNELESMIGAKKIMSGGSAANSVAGVASFGGQCAIIGKVRDDDYGAEFRGALKTLGIHYATAPYTGTHDLTGRSYIMITPDGERTMNTYLGANAHLSLDDVDAHVVAASKILLIEGYAFDQPNAKAAVEKAVRIAKESGTKVAFTLSDSRCVKRHHADFTALVRDHVDILLGNEKEVKALTLKSDFNEAASAIAATVPFAALTRGAKGAQIFNHGVVHAIAPAPIKQLVDTTGAGDAFAAGVLYGLSEGFDAARCGDLGAKAAAATIQHKGARSPDVKFSDFLR